MNFTQSQYDALCKDPLKTLLEMGVKIDTQAPAEVDWDAKAEEVLGIVVFKNLNTRMRLKADIMTAWIGGEIAEKWEIEGEEEPAAALIAAPAAEPVAELVATPEAPLVPAAALVPVPVKRVMSAEHKAALLAGKEAKKNRFCFKLASNVPEIVEQIDAGTRTSDTSSVSWAKGQVHHPKNPSVQRVLATMATHEFIQEQSIAENTGIAAKRIRSIMRELEKQGIAIAISRAYVAELEARVAAS